jgi:general secretion pathway protein K
MSAAKHNGRGERGMEVRQGGVAIVAAIVALAIAGTMAAEFTTNTTIDYVAASNARDSMRGELLARSGVNLARLVIRVQTEFLDKPNIRRFIGDIQLADFAPLFMSAFGGSKDEVENMGALLGGFAGEEIKGLGVPYGKFEVDITTEDNKINVNCANGDAAVVKNLETKLAALIYFEVYNPIFESADATGWRRDRKTQVEAIMDYIDKDTYKYGTPGAGEDYGYESLKDPYKPKNNSLDSVKELRLVRGIDERFWTVFGSAFTVYGGCKENLGAIQDPRMVMPLIFLTAKDQNHPVLRDPNKLWLLSKRVAEARSYGIYFDRIQAWADFVKNPDGALQSAAEGQDGTVPMPTDGSSGFIPVQGVEIDLRKLQQVAEVGPRRTYRVEATATIGRLKRRIMAVWDTRPTNQNSRDAAQYRNGSWVFWREE